MGPITRDKPAHVGHTAPLGLARNESLAARVCVWWPKSPMSPVSIFPSAMLRLLACLALSLSVLASFGAPARADVSDVMKRIQADGRARLQVASVPPSPPPLRIPARPCARPGSAPLKLSARYRCWRLPSTANS